MQEQEFQIQIKLPQKTEANEVLMHAHLNEPTLAFPPDSRKFMLNNVNYKCITNTTICKNNKIWTINYEQPKIGAGPSLTCWPIGSE